MPIVNELKSINRLEAAGFTHEQAKAIVEVAEEGAQSGFEKFVEVLDGRLGDLRSEMKFEFQTLRTDMQTLRTDMQTVRGDLLKEQRDQMLRFAALVTLIVSLIAAILGAALKWL